MNQKLKLFVLLAVSTVSSIPSFAQDLEPVIPVPLQKIIAQEISEESWSAEDTANAISSYDHYFSTHPEKDKTNCRVKLGKRVSHNYGPGETAVGIKEELVTQNVFPVKFEEQLFKLDKDSDEKIVPEKRVDWVKFDADLSKYKTSTVKVTLVWANPYGFQNFVAPRVDYLLRVWKLDPSQIVTREDLSILKEDLSAQWNIVGERENRPKSYQYQTLKIACADEKAPAAERSHKKKDGFNPKALNYGNRRAKMNFRRGHHRIRCPKGQR